MELSVREVSMRSMRLLEDIRKAKAVGFRAQGSLSVAARPKGFSSDFPPGFQHSGLFKRSDGCVG
jgi:hypothetical protein